MAKYMTKEQEKAAMPAAKKAVVEAARKRLEAKKGKQAPAPAKSAPKAAPAKKNKLVEAGKKFMGGMQSMRDAKIKKALKDSGAY